MANDVISRLAALIHERRQGHGALNLGLAIPLSFRDELCQRLVRCPPGTAHGAAQRQAPTRYWVHALGHPQLPNPGVLLAHRPSHQARSLTTLWDFCGIPRCARPTAGVGFAR